MSPLNYSKSLKFFLVVLLQAVKNNHPSYFKAYLSEKGAQQPGQKFDPIDLSLYVCTRLQGDNDWLVDKLAQVEK